MTGASTRPVTLLIAALGGEGGGVLTNWIVNAAQAVGLPVQATSIPGVAQRTGATTYYIEIWPDSLETLGGRELVLALSPIPGEVDIMAASELLEAGRAIQSGLVTPEQTFLISSTHRVYTTAEKMKPDDGRFDVADLLRAARNRSRENLLLDLEGIARESGAHMNSVLLGLIAASGKLPFGEDSLRAGIRSEGKASDANLRGFEAGISAGRARLATRVPGATGGEGKSTVDELLDRVRTDYPDAPRQELEHAVRRLTDYQDSAYAELYLERLVPFRQAAPEVLASVARHLAVRMSYEDIIRVAQAKIRPGRFRAIRAETGAGADEPVAVTEFFKPGLNEICDILPVGLARRLLKRAESRPDQQAFKMSMLLRTTTVWGFFRLRMLAGIRRWRRSTFRFQQEQIAIESWLDEIRQAASTNARLAVEIAECARLIKGYGATHARGTDSFRRNKEALINPSSGDTVS